MIYVVYHFKGTGAKFTGTENECRAWINKQTMPDEYWLEKAS